MSAALPLLLVILATAGLSACGGDDEADAGGGGFERMEAEGASVEVPDGWEKDPQGAPDEKTRELISLHGPLGQDGLFVRISLYRGELGGFKDAQLLGKNLTDTRAFELRKGRVVEDGEAEVTGADGAYRVVTEFTPELKSGGDGPRSQITELVAARGQDAYILAVAGPKRMIEDVDVKRVLGSLRLG